MKVHTLGFPRIGSRRDLKKAQESYWKGETSEADLIKSGQEIRKINITHQSFLDFVPVGDFSFYDHLLDMSLTLGNIPPRFQDFQGSSLDQAFRIARGRSSPNIQATPNVQASSVHASEMTKWFDTNYHYIVPEFSKETSFSLNPERLLAQVKEAQALHPQAKPIIVGPLTYLSLGKTKDETQKLDLLGQLVPVYHELLETLAAKNIEWVQIDEPILVTELDSQWQEAFKTTYERLSQTSVKLLLATYFGRLKENKSLVASLPVAGLHLDAVRAFDEIESLLEEMSPSQILSLGVIDGRNIWKTDLTKLLDWLEPLALRLQDRLWIAPSCSLLHVPVDLESEKNLDPEIKSWLSFALQKLEELEILHKALTAGRASVAQALQENKTALQNRSLSARVQSRTVQERTTAITPEMATRQSPFNTRIVQQRKEMDLPLYPTTTIGSFPQTKEIRSTRLAFRKGDIDQAKYIAQMQAEIQNVITIQEELGLDVLVHGEPERNDMVEYFGEQLQGYTFTKFGWVQSYGSRCVKPPILYGDISRPTPMTVEWTSYAQSLTKKPVKGMLTGPVTILNWSFVRDDRPRSLTCKQLALAIREEVLDLEKAGVKIIQIDEAALREGLPLRKEDWKTYLDWAVESFRICANGVKDTTQIHTHMCYSEFNDIIEAITAMDADVITIETSRSDMELLDVFDHFEYPNEIGPGVYDVHSPNVPTVLSMVDLLRKAAEKIPASRLWVNPDCGLKTRAWPETHAALVNMIEAAHSLRK